jgi:Tfp pilus assembly protein FimT
MARERGSVMMWMVGVIALVTVLALMAMATSSAATDDGRAQTAADLAALAGVSADRSAAASVARDNGATLIGFDLEGDVVAVTVRRDGVVATAHATEGETPTGL